jgi:hypothetical protein
VLAAALHPSDTAARVVIDGAPDEVSVEILDRPAAADAGTTVIAVERTITSGVVGRRYRVLVGSTTGPAGVPSPVPRGGLRNVPVVLPVLGTDAGSDVVSAGARRAGRGARIQVMAAHEPGLAAALLRAVSDGAEVIVVTGGDRRTLELARILDGRPVPIAPLPDREAIGALLGRCRVEVEVPVPVLEGRERERTWQLLRSVGVDGTHHLVEVDPRPAFDELGLDPRTASLVERSAAAAGVLAGRLAAANRRWRSAVE